MTDRFRVEITLSRVYDLEADNGHNRTGSDQIAHVDLTAGSAAEAMEQMKLHVTMLRDWYRQPTVAGYSFGGAVRVEDIQ